MYVCTDYETKRHLVIDNPVWIMLEKVSKNVNDHFFESHLIRKWNRERACAFLTSYEI